MNHITHAIDSRKSNCLKLSNLYAVKTDKTITHTTKNTKLETRGNSQHLLLAFSFPLFVTFHHQINHYTVNFYLTRSIHYLRVTFEE